MDERDEPASLRKDKALEAGLYRYKTRLVDLLLESAHLRISESIFFGRLAH
jgi:hypothetical protein